MCCRQMLARLGDTVSASRELRGLWPSRQGCFSSREQRRKRQQSKRSHETSRPLDGGPCRSGHIVCACCLAFCENDIFSPLIPRAWSLECRAKVDVQSNASS